MKLFGKMEAQSENRDCFLTWKYLQKFTNANPDWFLYSGTSEHLYQPRMHIYILPYQLYYYGFE